MGLSITCWGQGTQNETGKVSDDYSYSLQSLEKGSPDVKLLSIEGNGGKLVLLPSKSLSPLSCNFEIFEIFWKNPLESIPDPSQIDVTAAMLIDGVEHRGTQWVENFCAGVEFLGLENWGMHHFAPDGTLMTLHGNAGLIPVREVALSVTKENQISVSGEYNVYGPYDILPPVDEGSARWKVTRNLLFSPEEKSLTLKDTIRNLQKIPTWPDWGYHIQLRPEQGCRLVIPSDSVQSRNEAEVPAVYNIWNPARNENIREERGYIHVGVKNEAGFIRSELVYPGGESIEMHLPQTPFVMSWFSAGGEGSAEFRRPGEKDRLVIPGSWNGVGPEIGSSHLDPEKRIEEKFRPAPLEPDECLETEIRFKLRQ